MDCNPLPTQANAGPDEIDIPGDSIKLTGNPDVNGMGVWEIISGSGGILLDSINPTTSFYGIPGITYQLAWTISCICGNSSDTVIISFDSIYSHPCPDTPTA